MYLWKDADLARSQMPQESNDIMLKYNVVYITHSLLADILRYIGHHKKADDNKCDEKNNL